MNTPTLASAAALALGLAACVPPAPVVTAVELACSVISTANGIASSLPLSGAVRTAVSDAGVLCTDTKGGSDLTVASDATVILHAVQLLEPVLASVHFSASRSSVGVAAKVETMRAQVRQLHVMASTYGLRF